MIGGLNMANVGIYTNGIIKTKAVFEENQKVIITPMKESAFGMLRQYAKPHLISQEEEILHDEMVKKYN